MALPAMAKGPSGTVPSELRQEDRPLPLVVLLPQRELRAGRDPGGTYDVGGGIIGAIVDSSINSISRNGAHKAIGSSRDVLNGDDAEQVLMNAIRESVLSIPWVKMTEGGAVHDDSDAAKGKLLEQVQGPRVLVADCSYDISQRFQAVYAYCALAIATKSGEGQSEDRWKIKNMPYLSSVEAEVALSNPASGINGRREQWAADSAALLRKSLEHALTKAGMLVGRQLQLTEAGLLAAASKPKVRFVTAYVGMAGEHKGPAIDGFENIAGKIHPNPGGLMMLYKPGADGVTLVENGHDLYYNYAAEAP